MTTTFIISETKLRMFTDLNDNVDTELLRNAVRESQDIEIQRILGTNLYEKILSEINASTLSGVYLTLVEDYVQNSLLYWAYYYALEYVMLRPRNNGLLIPNGGENSLAVDRSWFEQKRQSIKNKAEFYSQKLTAYLIQYQQNYPELTQNVELQENIADYGIQYKSPIVFRYNTYSPHLKEAIEMGLPITYGRALSFLPPPSFRSTNKVK
jgi:hypothetical protein